MSRTERPEQPGNMAHRTPLENVQNYYGEFMYDRVIAEYFGRSDFHNLGIWRDETNSARDACLALMRELVALSPPDPRRVLEVGCGKGATTKELRAHWPDAEITGIDVSEAQLATSRTNCPDASFMLMDACEMTFPDSSFDLVISVEAAFQFPSRRVFLEHARRVLAPGGRLVLQDLLHHERPGAPITLPDLPRRGHGEPGRTRRNEGSGVLDPVVMLPAENYLSGPEDYAALLRGVGFERPQVSDVTAEGPRRFYRHFLSHLADREKWGGYDPEHLRMLRVGARLFARNVNYCLLVSADATG